VASPVKDATSASATTPVVVEETKPTLTSSTTARPTTKQPPKETPREGEPAADRAAAAPVLLASGKEVGNRDEGAVVAPTVSLASSPNLTAMNLPSVNRTPTLQTQSVLKGGTLLHRVNPAYPEFAQKQRIEGEVNLRIHINKEGSVENVQIISGNKFLGAAAADAVKRWKYEPVILNGEAQAVDNTVVVKFNLPKPR